MPVVARICAIRDKKSLFHPGSIVANISFIKPMRPFSNKMRAPRRLFSLPAFILACGLFTFTRMSACTIFVLTDTNHAFFCNNEDWSDPQTRIWFLPAGEGYYGAVYVGFENGYAQGGLNTEGLSFDWVAGYTEKWEWDSKLPEVRYNSGQRMLETCSTIEQAVAFFRNHFEAGFWRAKILVAARSGASVIIGARDGQLVVEPADRCRGFGYGQRPLDLVLAKNPQITAGEGFKILKACRQGGDYATKYSNVFDLKSGDVFLYPFPDRDDEVQLNLAAELKKGAHYYEMPKIRDQLSRAPRPLPLNMERLPVDKYKPLPDREPEVTAHVRAMISDAGKGTAHPEDFTPDFWKQIAPKQKEGQDSVRRLGDLMKMELVDRSDEAGQRVYRYRMEFANAIVLQRIVFNAQNQVVTNGTEAAEMKQHALMPPAQDIKPLIGIGVSLRVAGDYVVIQDILPGSPAAALKDIHTGDRILAIAQGDGPAVDAKNMPSDKVIGLIRGQAGTTVRLTLAAQGEDDSPARTVDVVRAKVNLPLH
jgi:hypothetical protein